MALTQQSPKHWAPDQKVIDYVASLIPDGARVLEIGPGDKPFPKATDFVDFIDLPHLPNAIKLDAANPTRTWPFATKEFDFVYARHIIEDSWNPVGLCEEMSRVAKAGYIETPSPIAELGRGVDATSPPFRGYHHHRWIVWMATSDKLRFVTKYCLVEYLKFDEDKIDQLLAQPKYWNTYCLWQDRVPYEHRQSPLDFSIPRDYAPMLADAMDASRTMTDDFYAKFT